MTRKWREGERLQRAVVDGITRSGGLPGVEAEGAKEQPEVGSRIP